MDLILDIGCCPGTAIQALASSFNSAVGLDPPPAMISIAEAFSDMTLTHSGNPILFTVSTAEDLGSNSNLVKNGAVYPITAATAAHWFDMPAFCRGTP